MSGEGRLEAFLAELKRRRVFRVAIGYAAVAFATVSVASDFLTALRLPDWIVTFVAVATVVGFPIALALAWLYDITPTGVQRTGAETALLARQRAPADRAVGFIGVGMVIALVTVGSVSQFKVFPFWAGGELPSIAVLPFANISTDPANEFFADGIHEEVMTQLYKLGGLTVISRTSVMPYRGTSKSIRAVGQELGVGAVLEASVRREGTRVRIDARLIDAEDDRQLWAESYDRDLSDALRLQAEIAEQIAEALHARLSSQEKTQLAQTRGRAVDARMYEVYLRGLYEAGEGQNEKAIATFRQALEIDPNFAPAYAAIARGYYGLAFFGDLSPGEAFGQLKAAATRALQLDPELADAHATLALYELHYEWDWEEADQRFRRALKLSPNHAQVRHDYAHYLLAVGRIRDSVEESEQASALDPANSMLQACAGWHDFTDREYDHAVKQSMQALMMMPGAFWPEIILGWAYQHKGQHGPAIGALRNAVTHSNGSNFAVASLAHGLARAGERTPARQLLAQLLDPDNRKYVSAYDVAAVYAGLGSADESFAWLRRAYAERSTMLVNIGWDPRFDALRTDPRYQGLIADMELPDRPKPRPARTPAKPSRNM